MILYKEYDINYIWGYLEAKGVDTERFETDLDDDQEVVLNVTTLPVYFSDGAVAANLLLTGYTGSTAVYKIIYLAEVLK